MTSSKRSHLRWMAFGLCPGTHAIEPRLTSNSPSFSPSLRTMKRTSLLRTTFGGISTSMSCRAMARRYKVHRGPRAIRETRGMRFAVEHEFAASRAAVIALACDPAFQSTLDLPDVSRPEVVEATVVASQHLLRLRYEFTGSLDPIARKLLA